MAAVHDDNIDLEDLQLDYDEMCDNVVDLQHELKAAKMETQQLRMRLKAAAVATSTVVTPQVQKMPAVTLVDPKQTELENFIVWLAQHACLDRPEEIDVDLEVPIGSRSIHMHRVVQWPLTFKVRKHLRLSAPIEMKDELQELLISAKKHGKIKIETLQFWLNSWELAPGDLDTVTQKDKEQVVMLAHKTLKHGILVASWPTVGALEAFRALCSCDGEPFCVGQRVEVEYDGSWYAGTVESLTATAKASVSCDADEPGVLTFAPVYRLRRVEPPKRTRALSYEGPQPYYEEPEACPRQRPKSIGCLEEAM
jgi:hypothetical protein